MFPSLHLTEWLRVAALQATEIFGSDGDAPPSFAEQWAAKVGKTMDKNFIDKRRPQPVRCVRENSACPPCDTCPPAWRKRRAVQRASDRAMHPCGGRLPRTLVYRPFAVLLMRSCYDAVDQLNFVPMDQFQKDFFLLRQNEWEKYLAENDCKQVCLRHITA